MMVIIDPLPSVGTITKEDDPFRHHGISPGMFYAWRKKYGGLEVMEARCLKTQEAGNIRL